MMFLGPCSDVECLPVGSAAFAVYQVGRRGELRLRSGGFTTHLQQYAAKQAREWSRHSRGPWMLYYNDAPPSPQVGGDSMQDALDVLNGRTAFFEDDPQ